MKKKIILIISYLLLIVGFMVIVSAAGISETELKTFGAVADKVAIGAVLFGGGCALGYKGGLFNA